jgi:hypothetical protein
MSDEKVRGGDEGRRAMIARPSPPHPLGLRPAEWRAIRDCMWARTQVPNGHYLPAFRNAR